MRRTDDGAALVMAIAFIFAVGMVLVALGGFAANALLNTNNLTSYRATQGNAEIAVTVAMRYERTRYSPADATTSCLPSGTIPAASTNSSSTNPMTVWCTTTLSTTSYYDRVVDFYACPSGVARSTCTANGTGSPLYLHARVAYSDFNFSGADSCTAASTATCGTAMTIDAWDVLRADT